MEALIKLCLSLAPVPYLSVAFSALAFIWSLIQQVQVGKAQLRVLAFSVAQLLQVLNTEYQEGRLLEAQTSAPRASLNRCGMVKQCRILASSIELIIQTTR